jgi:hypothetical protein
MNKKLFELVMPYSHRNKILLKYNFKEMEVDR